MKNLKLVFTSSYELSLLKSAHCYCVSTERDLNDCNNSAALYFYCNGIIKVLTESKELKDLYDVRNYFGVQDECLSNAFNGVGIDYQYLTKSLVLALRSGDVFTLDLDTNELQCIGSVDSGLTAMEWSPDFETVVFVTGARTIILMTAAFEPLTEINLFDTGPAIKELVNVGWGKKETQFHGSEGKSARTAVPVEGSKDVEDDKKPRISWRGDSNLFVVSVWSDETNQREIKIFNQEGVFQCHGESLPGLEHSIEWRPSGNIITLTQKLPNKHIVSFMEKNGLVHGYFALPSNIKVKDLHWNSDSTILCVVCEEKLLLYTFSNFHWYLKQQISLSSSPVTAVRWDPISPGVLYVVQSQGMVSVFQWIWNIYRTPSLSPQDAGIVAVIDGDRVLVTSFQKKVIPPPMCQHTVSFSQPVNEVAFAPVFSHSSFQDNKMSLAHDVNNFIVYLQNKKIVIVSNTVDGPTLSRELEIVNLQVESLHNFIWITPETLLCCGIKFGGQYFICELTISCESVIAKKHTVLSQPLLSIVSYCCNSSSSAGDALIQLTDGRLFKYKSGGEMDKLAIQLAEPCSELAVHNGIIISLSQLKRLYYNGDLFTSKATSFFIMPPFLLITTSDHTLLIYILNGSECELVSTRKLERGSKIITVTNDNIILQMPRGNLEAIQPRALTLHTAALMINRCEYSKVFGLLRKHRINMNLIVDHQPQAFLLTVTKFVQQIDDQSNLSLFLSELSDTDVTRTIYKDYYNQDDRPAVVDRKTERVCQALRGVMMTSSSDTNILDYSNPIITTYVKTNDMAEALKLAAQSNACLQHLLFLVDVDRLYNCALSLYNLDMALKIAEKSKRDPKEYVPYLNNLNSMDEEYMKFKIDCEFNKYDSALKNISQSSNDEYFKEALTLIENKSLHPQALQLYKGHPERYKKVCVLFAKYLMSKNAYEEAGHMFVRCGMLDMALNAFADAGEWRTSMMVAHQIHYGPEDIVSLGKHILQVLTRKGLYGEAAALSEDIMKDESLVIDFLVQGKLWIKALYYASCHPNINVETAVMPFVREEAVSIMEIIKENVEKMKKHSVRLTEVRLQKSKKKENPISDIDISDIKSDISSVSGGGYSLGTSRTGGTQSSKSTRKMQKKMWSLKEGNPREEFALLSVIAQLIRDLEQLTEDVSRCCSALLRFNDGDFDNLALNMQSSMKQALSTAMEIKHTVWPAQANENDLLAANELQDAQLKFPPTLCAKAGWDMRILDV